MIDLSICKPGDIVISLTKVEHSRKIGDIFTILKMSHNNLYYLTSTCNNDPKVWRIATKN